MLRKGAGSCGLVVIIRFGLRSIEFDERAADLEFGVGVQIMVRANLQVFKFV